MFDPALGSYAAAACVIPFLMTGHRSVYPPQVLAMCKSSSIKVEIGRELATVRPEFEPTCGRFRVKARRALRRLRRRAGREDGAQARKFQPNWSSEGYSTVTDLARLRGWSTSHPRRTATS